jgi:hypothetical protein
MFKVKNMESDNSLGLMEVLSMENLLIIIYKERVNTIGLMVENSMDRGWITKWKEVVSSHGQTAEDTRENTLMIKRKDKVLFTGQMVGNTKVAGKMENNMASEHTLQQVAKPNKENGKKERDSTGFRATDLVKSIFQIL